MRFPTPARVPICCVVAPRKPRAANTSSAASRMRRRTSVPFVFGCARVAEAVEGTLYQPVRRAYSGRPRPVNVFGLRRIAALRQEGGTDDDFLTARRPASYTTRRRWPHRGDGEGRIDRTSARSL